jgi:hypothetical protein
MVLHLWHRRTVGFGTSMWSSDLTATDGHSKLKCLRRFSDLTFFIIVLNYSWNGVVSAVTTSRTPTRYASRSWCTIVLNMRNPKTRLSSRMINLSDFSISRNNCFIRVLKSFDPCVCLVQTWLQNSIHIDIQKLFVIYLFRIISVSVHRFLCISSKSADRTWLLVQLKALKSSFFTWFCIHRRISLLKFS